MSKTKPNDLTIPNLEALSTGNSYWHRWEHGTGLTKREYFAARFLQGMLSNPNVDTKKNLAEISLLQADKFIDQLNYREPLRSPDYDDINVHGKLPGERS